jgi:hypothetical protein
MVYCIHLSSYVETSLHSRNKSHLVIVYNPLVAVGFSLLVFCWEICISFHKKYWTILLLWCLSLALIARWCWSHRMTLEIFPPFQFFEKVWEGLLSFLLSMFGVIHYWSHQVQSNFLVWGFLITDSISFIVIRSTQIFNFYLYISSWLSRFCICRKLSISSKGIQFVVNLLYFYRISSNVLF